MPFKDRGSTIDEVTLLQRDFPQVFTMLVELCSRGYSVPKIRNDIFKESGITVSAPAIRLVTRALRLAGGDKSNVMAYMEQAWPETSWEKEEREERNRDIMEEIMEDITAINSLRDVMRDVRAINFIISRALPKMEDYDLYRPRDILQAIVIKDQIVRRAESTILKRIAFLEEFMVQVFRILNNSIPEDIKEEVVMELQRELEKLKEGVEKSDGQS